jgi:hypothetical protein
LFTDRNPFKEDLAGDWLFKGAFVPHLGDVYLNKMPMYEAESVEKLTNPEVWPQAKYPEESKLVWYAEAGEKTTKIWANFGDADPTKEDVEITVRPFCFWPEKTGLNYITVRALPFVRALLSGLRRRRFRRALSDRIGVRAGLLKTMRFSVPSVSVSVSERISVPVTMSGPVARERAVPRESRRLFSVPFTATGIRTLSAAIWYATISFMIVSRQVW